MQSIQFLGLDSCMFLLPQVIALVPYPTTNFSPDSLPLMIDQLPLILGLWFLTPDSKFLTYDIAVTYPLV